MNKKLFKAVVMAAIGISMPVASFAQESEWSNYIHSLNGVLDKLYDDMIPMCSKLIGVGRGIAGFAALLYIATRVWRHIANAEPVDFYPLLRPFAMGLAILLFPALIALMNGVLKPTVTATAAMVKDSNKAIEELIKQRERQIQGTDETVYSNGSGSADADWYKYTRPEDKEPEGFWSSFSSFSFGNWIKKMISTVLQILFEAAALCINTIRTFYLIILAILGPLVLGFAVFDGFQHTLLAWFARYVNVFLWLPIANIFGSIIAKIQENMLRLDIAQGTGTVFNETDTAYMIFMVIAIAGYLTVPSIASYIINVGGANPHLSKVSGMGGGAAAAGAATAVTGGGIAADMFGDAARRVSGGFASDSDNYFPDRKDPKKSKLSGNA